MSRDPTELRPSRRLPELVPGLYLAREPAGRPDAPGRQLRALLGVLGGGLDALFDAVGGLWDDHFVERADAAALPLLAELLAARLVSAEPRAQRALLARIVAWRRRKGTLATIEEALTLTSGWDVEADEGFRSLLHTQDLAHLAPWRGTTAILWDPIGLADPLTRRAPGDRRPRRDDPIHRRAVVARLPWEAIDDTLRRLGRVDAGRHAASPRTLDLRGWARPDAVILRASRLHAIELEQLEATPAAPAAIDGTGVRRVHVDPLRRDTPLVWLEPLAPPDLIATTTARHEPEPPAAPARTGARLLTPTVLADDPARVEAAGGIEVAIEGVPLVGPARPSPVGGAMAAAPVGARGVLGFAEVGRPSPGDAWAIRVVAAIGADDDPSASDVELLSAQATATGSGAITVGPDARAPLGDRGVELVIERIAGRARARAADGAWSDLDVDAPLGPPVSNAAAVAVGAATWIVRAERDLAAGTNRLVRFALAAGATWTEVLDLPAPLDHAEGHAGGIAAIGDGTSLYLVATAGARLGAWRVTDLGGAPQLARLDAAGGRAPVPRGSPSLCVHDGRLHVFGGDLTRAAGDVWSLPLAGGTWQPHPLHRQQERMGATLLSTAAGLVLIGGDDVPGALEPGVYLWDPAAGRAWRPLPALPIEPGRPGVVVARAAGEGAGAAIEALVWADRTRPRRMFLPAGASRWEVGPIERGLPGAPSGASPPGLGEALFAGDRLLIVAPPPLPPSELLFALGGQGRIAFLPHLDLAPGRRVRLRVLADGGTIERPDPDAVPRPAPLDHRTAGFRAGELVRAPGGARRLSAPGYLARRRWALRQRSLGPWEALAPDDAEPYVALDPRLGRVVLPPDAPRGRITISARVGRAGAIGPGCAPAGDAVPAAWREPEPRLAPWPADARPPDVYLDPERAGLVAPGAGPDPRAVPIAADLPDAIAQAGGAPRLALVGSARIPAARLTAGIDGGLIVRAADRLGVPIIAADPERDVSLALHVEEIGAAPRFALAGLWLPGRLEVIAPAGQLDVRYCQIGRPGAVALWMPGAGHQELAARRSLPEPLIEVRLYGCMLGIVELPPWVQLVAAGCTFDADDRGGVAIRAAGARVRLRHCTIYGAAEAGELGASSCVFAGEVRVDRADLGFVRHSVLARGGRPPRAFACRTHTAGFISKQAPDPGYLALSANNGEILTAGEDGAQPGAYAEHGDHARELDARVDEFLPIGMTSFHVDRTTHDLYRLRRR